MQLDRASVRAGFAAGQRAAVARFEDQAEE
jgi:hypothetical protein